MDISVIIPTFNRLQMTIEAVESVQRQSHEDWECLVIDDRSNDGSAEKLREHFAEDSRISVTVKEPGRPKGANPSRNDGIKAACGDWIQLLDSDDLLAADKFAQQLSAASPHTDLVLCGSEYLETDGSTTNERWSIPQSDSQAHMLCEDLLNSFLTGKLSWSTNAPLWKASFLKKVYPLSEQLACSQDWHLNATAALLRPKTCYVRAYSASVRNHSGERITSNWRSAHKRQSQIHSRVDVLKRLKGQRHADAEMLQSLSATLVHYRDQCLTDKHYALAMKAHVHALRSTPGWKQKLGAAMATPKIFTGAIPNR